MNNFFTLPKFTIGELIIWALAIIAVLLDITNANVGVSIPAVVCTLIAARIILSVIVTFSGKVQRDHGLFNTLILIIEFLGFMYYIQFITVKYGSYSLALLPI